MSTTPSDKDLAGFLQEVVYEYGLGQENSKHYTKTSYGGSFATDDFCKEKASVLDQIISRHYIKKSEVAEALDSSEIEYVKLAKCPACGAGYMYQCTCDVAGDYVLKDLRAKLQLEEDV